MAAAWALAFSVLGLFYGAYGAIPDAAIGTRLAPLVPGRGNRMTLPYPHGLETGRLESVEAVRRDPTDIEQRVRRLVVPEDGYVGVAGHRLQVADTRTAEAEAARMRTLLSRRLLARRPNADEATWRKLVESLHAALASRRQLDDDAIEQSLLLIDGL